MSQSQGVKEDQQAEGERGGRTRERMWLVWLERLGEQSGVGLGQFCPSPGSLNCSVQFSSVQLLSHVRLSATPWLQHARPLCPPPLKLMSIESVTPSHHLICRPLLLPPLIFPSIRVFSNESVLCIRWPKYWSFSISPSSEYSGLISFRMDWLDLLAVQGTLKSLLQHHSSKAPLLQNSAFFIIQLLHPYMTTGKTIALD